MFFTMWYTEQIDINFHFGFFFAKNSDSPTHDIQTQRENGVPFLTWFECDRHMRRSSFILPSIQFAVSIVVHFAGWIVCRRNDKMNGTNFQFIKCVDGVVLLLSKCGQVEILLRKNCRMEQFDFLASFVQFSHIRIQFNSKWHIEIDANCVRAMAWVVRVNLIDNKSNYYANYFFETI